MKPKHLTAFFMTPLFLLVLFGFSPAQRITRVDNLKASKPYDNLLVQKAFSDSYVSSFVIWIDHGVKKHLHQTHSEHVFVLKGKGVMTLGEEKIKLGKGDLIFIPKNTPHAVQVLKKMKVLSIQAPEFHGEDRIFLE